MSASDPGRTHLKPVPMLAHESLYVGIDIGKRKHVAGFLSNTLLQRYQRFEACPTLTFEQSREGFRALANRLETYTPLTQIYVLLEHTGHYHFALEQYLQELDIAVYIIHVQKRPKSMLKTDKRDALSLANMLYSQLELGAQVANKLQLVRRALPPTEAAKQLRGLIRHRYELQQESTQRKNKLTSLCDQLFPELTQIFKNPNLPTALLLRERFPTPQALAAAPLTVLQEVRGKSHYFSDAKLIALQQLASQSIGVKDAIRQRSLIFEQQQHIIGPIPAATLIATIGNIANFSRASELKSYLGWVPTREQTGTSFDRSRLTHGGSRVAKQMLFLIVWSAIQRKDQVWDQLYERLVPRMCSYDERTQSYKGRGKVIGRIAGQMIAMCYAFLMTDYEATAHLPVQRLPQPEPRPRLPVRVAAHTAWLVKAAQVAEYVGWGRSSKRSGEP